MAGAALGVIAVVAWLFVVFPRVSGQIVDLPYTLNFESRDNLYDTARGKFGEISVSKSAFTYEEARKTERGLLVRGEFDVRMLSGERIFNAVREYEVDAASGRILGQDGAEGEPEYLFAPRFLGKRDFTFRYVSYDAPIRLRYVGAEKIEGVTTSHYVARLTLDNTANFAWLVGDSGDGVRYQVDIEAWFEPLSGHLVKLDDEGSIELFDKDTGETIRPWNRYRNEPTEASVAFQAGRARLERSILIIVSGVPALLAVLAFIAILLNVRKKSGRDGDTLSLPVFGIDVVLPALVVFGLSMSATTVASQIARLYVDEHRRDSFDQEARGFMDETLRRIDLTSGVLRSAVALHDASKSVERDEWRAFAGSISVQNRYPGVLGLGLVRAFDDAGRDAFLATVRSDGQPDFEIRPAEQKGEHAVVAFMEPQDEDNLRAIGFDMMSDDTRRIALETARDTGQPAISSKISLFRDANFPGRSAMIMVMPFYRHGAPISNVAERRAALEGYAYSPIRITDLVSNVLGIRRWLVNVAVYDGDSTQSPILFGVEPKDKETLRRTDSVIIAGRPWTFEFTEVPGAIMTANDNLPAFAMVGGLGISFVLAFATVTLSTSRRRAVRIARRATVQLSDSYRQLQTLIDTVPVGIFWAKSPGGEPIMVNEAAKELLGRGIDPAVNAGSYAQSYDLVREDGSPYPTEELPLVRTISTGKVVVKSDVFVRRPDGTKIALRVVSAPIASSGEMGSTAVAVFQDFTREYELDRQKSDFISITSHQLRTPLAAIRWFVEMLQSEDLGPLNESQKEHVGLVLESNDRMITLVNDLLNVSRIESGTIDVAPVETDVVALAKGVVAELAPLVAERKQSLKEAFAADTPRIKVDPKLLRQVFVNLLSNAVKYTPEGGAVSISSEARKDDVLFTVADSGIGIPKAQQARLFTKFFRADNAQASEADGSGLGLYVCKSVVEMSGGTIWFESAEGAGSKFFFTLPRKGSPARKGTKSLA